MSINYADRIYIVTETPEQGQELRASISLRGFDRVKCYSVSDLEAILMARPPDLLILDAGGQTEDVVRLIASAPCALPPTIWLVETYEPEQFLTCYDAGARDFLVQPVDPAYLVSRVLLALDERHLAEQLAQREAILKELSVMSVQTDLYTEPYFKQFVKRELTGGYPAKLSLLLLEISTPTLGLEGRHIASLLKQCCRCADLVGEWGSEHHYAILLPDTDIEGGTTVAHRIQTHVQQSAALGGNLYMGVTDALNCVEVETLFHRVTQALQAAHQNPQQISVLSG